MTVLCKFYKGIKGVLQSREITLAVNKIVFFLCCVCLFFHIELWNFVVSHHAVCDGHRFRGDILITVIIIFLGTPF
jgi:hypothetical protein